MRYRLLFCSVLPTVVLANPACAKEGDPVEIADGVTIDPIFNALLRYETVSQDNIPADANAVTLGMRGGFEAKKDGFSFLVEAEGNLAIVDDYNDTIPGNGIEPFPVVADPDNVDLNRLQIGYQSGGFGITVGRQRINLDDQRFAGSVAWRQSEQTFDAVRGTAKLGPVALDATYAIEQRTIFGTESPNERFEGDFILLNGSVDLKPLKITAFSYILDYETRLAFSSQTYGVRASGAVSLGENVKLNLLASYARQSDVGSNPVDYSADYLAGEAGLSISGFSLKAGYEELGSDGGFAAFQTPLATLHKFNGFADLFLVTPAAGLQDVYVGAGYKLAGLVPGGVNLGVTYHQFDAAEGGADYGSEVDAVVGFKLGPVAMLAKYANYNADGFGVDKEVFWLQAGYSF